MQVFKDEDTFHVLVHRVLKSIQGQEANGWGISSDLGHVPIVEFVNRMIEEAVQCRATDIHIEPMEDAVRIRFRIDGNLCETHEHLPLKMHAFLISRLKVMAHMDTTKHQNAQDGRILYQSSSCGRPLDIRLATIPLLFGEKAVLRLLDSSHELLNISNLDFSQRNEERFRQLYHLPGGLILLSGPVNSGKTTSLYAVLSDLNTTGRNLMSIEDPVEYQLAGVNQIQVNPKTGMSFAEGLRAILRQDPDVVMVGEIRDEETAEIAVRAALTGRLLLSTIHTGHAAGALFRLLDMGIAPYLLASAIAGVLAQRLVRRICPECKVSYRIEAGSSEALFLGDVYQEGLEAYRGTGCTVCNGTGYLGRIALQELLVMNTALRQAILKRQDLNSIRGIAVRQRMLTLRQDGIAKALQGSTTLAEVVRISDKEGLR